MINLFTLIFLILLPLCILGHVHWGWVVGAILMHYIGSWAIKKNAENQMDGVAANFRDALKNFK